ERVELYHRGAVLCCVDPRRCLRLWPLGKPARVWHLYATLHYHRRAVAGEFRPIDGSITRRGNPAETRRRGGTDVAALTFLRRPLRPNHRRRSERLPQRQCLLYLVGHLTQQFPWLCLLAHWCTSLTRGWHYWYLGRPLCATRRSRSPSSRIKR